MIVTRKFQRSMLMIYLGVDEIGSIPSIFDLNFAPMNTEKLNVFIQQK